MIVMMEHRQLLKVQNRVVKYKTKKYFPGAALNTAVKYAKNEIIVFLSAHCIPTRMVETFNK